MKRKPTAAEEVTVRIVADRIGKACLRREVPTEADVRYTEAFCALYGDDAFEFACAGLP